MVSSKRLPVLFIGHGNPMHAIQNDAFSQTLKKLGSAIGKPKAILCISAHWMTDGTWVTHMPKPKTIHDFYGFPKELFAVQYPAPGSPEIADLIESELKDTPIQLDNQKWGLDHGTWSILKHMYPEADIPVVQLSLHIQRSSEYHYGLGQKLRFLREKDVLIIGSGNLVHNLGLADFNGKVKPYDWAIEFDTWVKGCIERGDHAALVHDARKSKAGQLSIPSFEHWFPLLYVLGASDENDKLRFEFECIENSSISMRCVSFGLLA